MLPNHRSQNKICRNVRVAAKERSYPLQLDKNPIAVNFTVKLRDKIDIIEISVEIMNCYLGLVT